MAVAGKLRAQPVRSQPFDARQYGNLRLWLTDYLRYQDSGYLADAKVDGDPVGAWQDRSYALNHALQSGASARPVLKKYAQNGRDVVRTDAVNDYLQLTLGIALTGALTIYCVGRRNAASTFWIPLGSGTTSDDVMINNSDNKAYFVAGANVASAAYTGPNNQHILARWKRDASNAVTFRSTGQADTAMGTASGTITLNTVGARVFNGFYAVADYDALLVYDGEISDAGRTALEAALTQRWAVTF